MNDAQRAKAVMSALDPYIWQQPCPNCGSTEVKFFYGFDSRRKRQKWLDEQEASQTIDRNQAHEDAGHRGRHFTCACGWIEYDYFFENRYTTRHQCPLCCP